MTRTDIDRLHDQQLSPHTVQLWRALQPLRSCVSFMNTGAHPDDETTPMLTAIGLRDGVKLSHACSTRGEGGQNNLGPEVTKDLGALRTREMERAAAIIDMTHYWLSETPDDSIFDFGFSKSGDETLNNWNEARTLERFVHILRTERPDIVAPTFLDISGQHGHHRAMTRSAFKAVILAADPDFCPEQNLDIWQVKKLYLPAWSGAGDAYDDDVPPPPETVQIDATGADPVLGADYTQISEWSHGCHQTQGMGRWIDAGEPAIWPLHLAWAANGNTGNEKSIFDALPKTLADLAKFTDTPQLSDTLNKAQTHLDNAIKSWPDSTAIRTHASAALALIRTAHKNCPDAAKSETLHRLEAKQEQLQRVLFLASNIRARLTLSANTIRPGETIDVDHHIHTPDFEIKTQIIAPANWNADTKTITAPTDAEPTNPYPDTWHPNRPNELIYLQINWEVEGQKVSHFVAPEERLTILPSHSATLSIPAAIIVADNPGEIELTVSNIHPAGATPELISTPGWKVTKSGANFTLKPTDNLQAGLHDITLTLDGAPAKIIHQMGYAHIGPVTRIEPAVLGIQVLDIAKPTGRIAYIGGGSDRTDFWLRALGIEIDTLGDAALEQTDFSNYDAILIGIFAFRTRPILDARLNALHDWVRDGGNLVTLYHRPWDNWDENHTALAPLKIGKPSLRWRVTDQNAEVTPLEPNHPLLNHPNKITEQDWAGWHKERGLYFAASWDDAYTPLLSMADPDEQPLTGSLLTGKFGKGTHTHTSLILHHQLDKLVPGAYRLLANLLDAKNA